MWAFLGLWMWVFWWDLRFCTERFPQNIWGQLSHCLIDFLCFWNAPGFWLSKSQFSHFKAIHSSSTWSKPLNSPWAPTQRVLKGSRQSKTCKTTFATSTTFWNSYYTHAILFLFTCPNAATSILGKLGKRGKIQNTLRFWSLPSPFEYFVHFSVHWKGSLCASH